MKMKMKGVGILKLFVCKSVNVIVIVNGHLKEKTPK